VAARANDELAKRAADVIARIEWPGKPGAAAPIAPLTPDQQRQYDAGQKVYESLCIACHQADGRGRDRLAPTLVGSALALAPAHVPVRILINGKEGTVGLMPPLGATLTDDQIADVLTYVRREWGQTGSPVDLATVRDTRALVTGRTRPWTAEELTKLLGGGH
jgi:mono/diheme cytochrome c family protein